MLKKIFFAIFMFILMMNASFARGSHSYLHSYGRKINENYDFLTPILIFLIFMTGFLFVMNWKNKKKLNCDPKPKLPSAEILKKELETINWVVSNQGNYYLKKTGCIIVVFKKDTEWCYMINDKISEAKWPDAESAQRAAIEHLKEQLNLALKNNNEHFGL